MATITDKNDPLYLPPKPGAANSQLAFNERMTAILESDAGLRNPPLARELALRSTMDARSAIAILTQAPAAESPFHQAMAVQGPIGLDPGQSGAGVVGSERATRLAQISRATAAYNVTKGYTPRSERG